MIRIDADTAIQGLKEIAEEKPDFVYQSPENWRLFCTYLNESGDGPDCGVGVVLFRTGVSVETLGKLDDEVGEARFLDGAETKGLDLVVTEEAAKIFNAFQYSQDRNKTWEEAYKEAKKVYDQLTV